MLTYALVHEFLKPLRYWSAAIWDGVALLMKSA